MGPDKTFFSCIALAGAGMTIFTHLTDGEIEAWRRGDHLPEGVGSQLNWNLSIPGGLAPSTLHLRRENNTDFMSFLC